MSTLSDGYVLKLTLRMGMSQIHPYRIRWYTRDLPVELWRITRECIDPSNPSDF